MQGFLPCWRTPGAFFLAFVPLLPYVFSLRCLDRGVLHVRTMLLEGRTKSVRVGTRKMVNYAWPG